MTVRVMEADRIGDAWEFGHDQHSLYTSFHTLIRNAIQLFYSAMYGPKLTICLAQ